MIGAALAAAQPDSAVRRALNALPPTQGELVLISIGKAAWQMAAAAVSALGSQIRRGVVITKYGHSCGPLGSLQIFEAGHPVPDENSFRATEAAMTAV